jgi:CRP-like cAMP-binding protein
MAFVNAIANLIHEQDHHPELLVGYNYCTVRYNTHSVNNGKGGISENDFICAINSYFLNIPSPHYIETIEPATLLIINRQDVNYLCDTYHDFDRFGRLAVTQTMLQLQQRVVSLQFESAQQRYETLTKLRPDITQRVPLGHIASYLGMTLETLSRARQPKKSNLI